MASTDSSSLTSYAGRLRHGVDVALQGYCRWGDGCPPRLGEAIQYSLLAPGKRLRPTLVLLAAEACGGTIEAAMPAACAVEMVHAYSLVHDDLPAMDDDDLRRGRPTCHKAFDEATAILAGDALLAMAFEVLARDVQPPAVAARCCAELARAAGPCCLVGGQADDLAPLSARAGVEALESIHRRKTGALIEASLRLGAISAAAAPQEIEAITEYGRGLGLAFQITDDLLDVRGDEASAGKRLGKDAHRGKLTYPGLWGIDESLRRAEELIAAACAAVAPLGARAGGLEALARYVLERNR
jgi:geranylgeranyl diphosphate synthase type II